MELLIIMKLLRFKFLGTLMGIIYPDNGSQVYVGNWILEIRALIWGWGEGIVA